MQRLESHRKDEYLTVHKVHGVQLPKGLLLAEHAAGAETVAMHTGSPCCIEFIKYMVYSYLKDFSLQSVQLEQRL